MWWNIWAQIFIEKNFWGESDPHLRFYYEQMAKFNDITKTKIVLVDKDLQNIRMISNFYTEATTLLCEFPVCKCANQEFVAQLVSGEAYPEPNPCSKC